MLAGQVAKLLNAQIIANEDKLDTEFLSACGSDLMSDVLACVKDQGLLVTGLVNAQVIRTAEMMDMNCIVFVRNKKPDEMMIELAKQKGIILMSTSKGMFLTCGLLYENGLGSGRSIV